MKKMSIKVIIFLLIFIMTTSLYGHSDYSTLAPIHVSSSIAKEKKSSLTSGEIQELIQRKITDLLVQFSELEEFEKKIELKKNQSGHVDFLINPETTAFGRKLSKFKGQYELMLAMLSNFTTTLLFNYPFDEHTSPLEATPRVVNESETALEYGISSSYQFQLKNDEPLVITPSYIGDGRTQRDLMRMNEGVDPRAKNDISNMLTDPLNRSFPIVPNAKISKKGNRSIIHFEKAILDEMFECQIEVFSKKGVDAIAIEELPAVTHHFYIPEGSKIAHIQKKLDRLNPDDRKAWFKERGMIQKVYTEEDVLEGELPQTYINLWENRKGKTLEVWEITGPCFKIKPIKTSLPISISIHFKVKTSPQRYCPKPLSMNNLINEDNIQYLKALKLLREKGDLEPKHRALIDMLIINYQSLPLMIYENTVLAGIFSYMTYFGRDTAFSYLLLSAYLKSNVKNNMVQQLLNRASDKGEGAHEIDSREVAGVDKHYDYRMKDTDLLLGLTSLDLMLEQNPREMSEFLSLKDQRNRYHLRDGNELKNGQVIFRNLNLILNEIEKQDLLSIKRDDDPSSGNWRDALNSLGRGYYPYDVNQIWLPHLIENLILLNRNSQKKKIIQDFLQKLTQANPLESYPSLQAFLYESEKKQIILLEETQRKKSHFNISFELQEWRRRLKRFYSSDKVLKDPELLALLKMPIAFLRDNDEDFYTTEDFLNDVTFDQEIHFYIESGNLFLPSGNPFPKSLSFHTMILDKERNTVPVVHSDIAFDLFLNSKKGQKVNKTSLLPFELPISLGGLALISKEGKSLGFVVANPMLAEPFGYDLVLTPEEKRKNLPSKLLSPWDLLDRGSYHGMGAIWEVMIDFFIVGLQQVNKYSNQEYVERIYQWSIQNYFQQSELRNMEVLGYKYDRDKEDFVLALPSVESIDINPLQIFNCAGRFSSLMNLLSYEDSGWFKSSKELKHSS